MIHYLNATNKLTPYKAQLEAAITSAIQQCKKIHPLKPLDIVVAENKWMAIPEHGVGGYTSMTHMISISLDLDKQNVSSNIQRHLPPMIAHELAHVVRLQAGLALAGGTLGDSVVGEGIADHLSRHIYPDADIPWSIAVEGSELDELRRRFVDSCKESPFDHSSWFYGNEEKNLPRWTGYSLGYALVRDYLQSTSKNVADILVTPTEEVAAMWLSQHRTNL